MAPAQSTPPLPPPGVYAQRWCRWPSDTRLDAAGVSFDRTPVRQIHAPPGAFRVCAYHIDFDERPVCWLDVSTLEEALHVRANLGLAAPGWNVDLAVIYDDAGKPL